MNFSQKVFGKGNDIFETFAKGGQFTHERRNPVIKIGSKFTTTD